MAKKPKVKWTTTGMTLKGEAPIEFLENESNIKMDGQTEFGKPIDAPMAVKFIANLLDFLPDSVVFGKGNSKMNEELKSIADKQGIKEEVLNEIVRRANDFENQLAELFAKSLAITFDKSTVLKTLSQPGCEGLRLYHCLKTDDKGKPTAISVVIVGVDAKGQDLYYEFDPTIKGNIEQIHTLSALSEYGSTSGGGRNSKILDLKEHILLLYAFNSLKKAQK